YSCCSQFLGKLARPRYYNYRLRSCRYGHCPGQYRRGGHGGRSRLDGNTQDQNEVVSLKGWSRAGQGLKKIDPAAILPPRSKIDRLQSIPSPDYSSLWPD